MGWRWHGGGFDAGQPNTALARRPITVPRTDTLPLPRRLRVARAALLYSAVILGLMIYGIATSDGDSGKAVAIAWCMAMLIAALTAGLELTRRKGVALLAALAGRIYDRARSRTQFRYARHTGFFVDYLQQHPGLLLSLGAVMGTFTVVNLYVRGRGAERLFETGGAQQVLRQRR
jgi:hypothetical protein